MTVNTWSENISLVEDEVSPQIVSGMFLRFTPFVVLVLITGVVTVSLTLTRNVDLPNLSQVKSPPVQISDLPKEDNSIIVVQNPPVPSLSPIFTDEVLYWQDDILNWADQWGLDPNLIATVMQIESCGYAQATSGSGATGLFQVMPFHFKESEYPYDPATNAYRGMAHLIKSLNAHSGEMGLAFAGYNAGIAGSMQPRSNWANETKRYVYWATGIYQDAINGVLESTRLQEWLDAGGSSLCRQAANYQKESTSSQ